MTQKLIKTLGIAEVEKAWIGKGMNAWRELSERMNEYVSPYVLRYMSNKYSWKRMCNPRSAIYKAVVIKKTMPAAYYKHLIFPTEELRDGKRNNSELSE
ncbi:MAG: hypothetical protein D8M51_13260 [Ignavibacteriae bacterium]|jgi:hypothetical protein|nr:hypothetical protein [Ignavibacteriota bacterium]